MIWLKLAVLWADISLWLLLVWLMLKLPDRQRTKWEEDHPGMNWEEWRNR